MSVSLRCIAAAAAFVLAASACSGSKGGSTSGQPVANAGVDRTAWKGALVSLDGRASQDPEGDALSYRWLQTEGPTVALSDDRAAQPTFAAPHATATLRFALAVSDGRSTSAPDEVIVSVRNRVPYADAGPDAVAPIGEMVTLDAARSSDPDGDPLAATWYQRSGPPVSLTTHPGGTASFVAPAASAVLEFGLVVSDGEGTSAEDRLLVHVADPAVNWPPTADAGADREVARRSVVFLYGSGYDREWEPLTYTWTQIGGPSVALLGADSPTPSFVAPAEDADLEFQLVVADPFSTATDGVVVRVRNLAPVVLLSLSPAAPITTDPLVATVSATDPDGDAVTLAWEWRRNGAVLAGVTGSTLDPSQTTRADVITVRVTASDGSREAFAEATVEIGDAPTALTVTAPASVPWGEPAAFTVTASDPDGDPLGGNLDLVLLRGPAGMTLTVDGAGAWTPTLPMFDRALDVSFAVGVAGAPDLRGEATIRVEDPDRAYPLRRSGIEIPTANGLAVIDADGDGTSELLVAGRTGIYELARAGDGYAQRWMYPFATGSGSVAAIAAGDVDGDGRPEIFVGSTGDSYAYPPQSSVLVKLDGVARREVARVEASCLDLELGDVDGDGALEVACVVGPPSYYGSLQRLAVRDAGTLTLEWESPDLALGTSLAIGNVDADAMPEIVTPGGYVFDGATGAVEWAYSARFGSAVDTGDLDGDGVEEIVGMDAGSRIRGFDARLKSPIWEQASSGGGALLVADANGDGVPEIVGGDGSWGNVTAYRYRPATNDLETVLQVGSQDYGVSALAVADLDGDGRLELAWGTGAGTSGEDVFVVAGGNPLAVEWKNVNPSQLDGPFLGARPARTAAGAAPGLLFQVPRTDSGYAGSRLVRLDPATGAVELSPEVGSNWNGSGALDVFDFDRDGVDEAFLSTANLYDGYLAAYDFAGAATEWTSPADAGSAAALTHADLNGDGAPDLVSLSSSGYVIAYDVAGSTLLWKSTSLTSAADVEIADVDGDAAAEIVALGGGRLVLFHRNASAVIPWIEGASAATSGSDLAIADCDGDGAVEIYVLAGDSYPYGGGASVLRFDGALVQTGSLSVGGTATALFVEDLGFARKNLVLAKGNSSYYWPYTTETTLEAVDPLDGAKIWESPPLVGGVPKNSLSYVDLDGDGFRELAFGTGSGMYLTR